MKKTFSFLAAMLAVIVSVSAQDSAAAIITRANEINNASTMSSRSRMVITARDGSTSERVIDQFSKDDANGNARSVIVFQNPATVRGTRFLTMDTPSGRSDQWIFLPSLGRVRRIVSSESGGNFMGTDFSYDDMSMMGRSVDLDTHRILREETLNGNLCYVIESVPIGDFQYARTLTWIDKANYRTYRKEMFDRRGTLVKVMEMSGFRDVQGYDTPMETKLSTVAADTFTTIFFETVRYDEPIPEGVFTTGFLETGRAR